MTQNLKQPVTRSYVQMVMNMGLQRPPVAIALLHKHGRMMPVSPEHAGNAYMGQPKECYSNSARVVMGVYDDPPHDLYYCEGYAATAALGLPIEHAWLCDGQGRVIDPTWPESGGEYFGVTFTREFVMDCVCKTEHYGLLCNLYMLPRPLRDYEACLAYFEGGILELGNAHLDAG